MASLQSAHDATILLAVFPGKKKCARAPENALEPKELLWIPNAKSQWKHMETMQPKQCNIEQSLGGIRDRSSNLHHFCIQQH